MRRLVSASLVALFFFFVAPAHAQILLKQCKTLYTGATVNASATSAIQGIGEYRPKVMSARAIATPTSGTTPTLDLKVQSCEDSKDTTTCSDRFTFDQCTTGTCWTGGRQTSDLNSVSGHTDQYFRVVATLGGTSPVYSNVTVKLCYD